MSLKDVWVRVPPSAFFIEFSSTGPCVAPNDQPPSLRIGQGFDTHRLAPVLSAAGETSQLGNKAVHGKPLKLGGVTIPHDRGPIAHSDGDVLLHALIDALLGAVGSGDIGERFPDTDPQYLNVDSAILVKVVVDELVSQNWQIANLDATIFAQRPKLSLFKAAMTTRVAELLDVPASRVNIKAKTGERVGPVGNEEAIEAAVTVLLWNNHVSDKSEPQGAR